MLFNVHAFKKKLVHKYAEKNAFHRLIILKCDHVNRIHKAKHQELWPKGMNLYAQLWGMGNDLHCTASFTAPLGTISLHSCHIQKNHVICIHTLTADPNMTVVKYIIHYRNAHFKSFSQEHWSIDSIRCFLAVDSTKTIFFLFRSNYIPCVLNSILTSFSLKLFSF